MIRHDECLRRLAGCEGSCKTKLVLGVRGCGKTMLLNEEYRRSLLARGVNEDRIIYIDLSAEKTLKKPSRVTEYLEGVTANTKENIYIFIDGIHDAGLGVSPRRQSNIFEATAIFSNKKHVNVYLTGLYGKSLLKMSESFRSACEVIPVYPLSFSEYYTASGGSIKQAFSDYVEYGGLPGILSCSSEKEKQKFLSEVLGAIIKDLANKKEESEDLAVRVLSEMAKSVGIYTTTGQIAQKAAESLQAASLLPARDIVACITKSMLFDKVRRYDLTRGKYISSPQKFFCADAGLLNAMTGFAPRSLGSSVENIIYNELKLRGLSTAMATVYYWDSNENGTRVKKHADIGFIVEGAHGSANILYRERITDRKEYSRISEQFALLKSSCARILIRGDMEHGKGWLDENGIMNISVIDFVLDKTIIL